MVRIERRIDAVKLSRLHIREHLTEPRGLYPIVNSSWRLSRNIGDPASFCPLVEEGNAGCGGNCQSNGDEGLSTLTLADDEPDRLIGDEVPDQPSCRLELGLTIPCDVNLGCGSCRFLPNIV